LHAAFVGAFRSYLNVILAERGLSDLAPEVLDEAEAWLDRELGALLELPYPAQQRSPLELVQQALLGPTRALEDMGIKPVLRDPVAVAALPGDVYALAPASSAVLGEEAFHAHLTWGAAKAQAMAPLVSGEGRRVVVVSRDLMDRSRFEDVVLASGLVLEPWDREASWRPVVAFVDLGHGAADDAISNLAARGVRVVAYGPHVDDDSMARAATLGADVVLPRSKLFRSIADYLPRLT
jgi:hypothetical protein